MNGADSKAAQVFTLAHELAHLWLGETALSDLDPQSIRSNAVERWCNQVAAEFLVPMAEFRERPSTERADLRAQLRAVSPSTFRVSSQVILGRIREAGASDVGRVPDGARRGAAAGRRVSLAERGGGGNYYNTKPVQVSRAVRPSASSPARMEGQHARTPRPSGCSDVKKASTFEGLAERLGVV